MTILGENPFELPLSYFFGKELYGGGHLEPVLSSICTIMPKYTPSIPFEDCYGSVGELTYYHKDGQCYYRKRASPAFPGTMRQMEHQEVHLRAIAAWQQLESSVQKQWNAISPAVIVHRPPFDGKAHMSGYNLFVSAYHGFATLGDEHVPAPVPWKEFPVHAVDRVDGVSVVDGSLRIGFAVRMEESVEAGLYRLLVRLQLAKPGGGRNQGKMRSFLADGFLAPGDSVASVTIPDYISRWGLDLQAYTLHCKINLLDSRTGYRNIFRLTKFDISL